MGPRLQKLCCALTFSLTCTAAATAQLINVRTAPVNVSEQFYTFPSQYLGMGGGLAVRDLWAEPFSNPAAAARIDGAFVSSTPTLYRMANSSGFGRTLPVTVMDSSPNESAFAGVSLAAQELESAFIPRFQNVSGVPRTSRFADNYYAFGLMGQKLPHGHGAVAASMSYSKVDHLHMVDLLYPEAAAIQQGGSITDMRLGYIRDFGKDQSLEAVVVRNHVAMEHTVTYVDSRYVYGQGWITSPPRNEYNADKTTTWGAHAAYRTPIPQSTWHIATFLTANLKAHPKIPNYNFSHLPRDPGNTRAYSFGVGLLNSDTAGMLAFDLVYTPMWTSTWAEAASPTKTHSGIILPIGAPTVENEFVFSNYEFHAGWAHKFDQVWVQAGLDVLSVHYALDQYDDINELQRNMDNSWHESTLSWGISTKAGRVQLAYFGHVRGAEFPSFGEQKAPIVNVPPSGGGVDIVSAPTSAGTVLLDPNEVIAHQFSVTIPFGRKRN